MQIKHTLVVLDAADVESESRFWAGVLGGTVEADGDWHEIVVDGKPCVAVQLAPEHVPPQWPDGEPQQIHLDLWIDDITEGHEHVMALGARLLKAAENGNGADTFQVYADPAGHPFCLCW
ncbi:VOC family protein [Georgenia sp. 311]|uniref:VOC family protein n=1 Tax=Georgenia wutianyii TaxID=2585135 RepID=A0ABX5VN31_9MICO|nr:MULTISPECIES: VOC family protein [Georgenia]QDB79914.1 VOC family protein [Georgenia wutianyii]TNC19689.1 VOC family protein [Georgenia sp. 311]